MKKVLALLLLSPAICVVGQDVNAKTNINWAAISGAGVPATSCTSANYGQPYIDTSVTPNEYYVCGSDGWAKRGGLSAANPTFTGNLSCGPTGCKVLLGRSLTPSVGSMWQYGFDNDTGDGYNIQAQGLGTHVVAIGAFWNSLTTHVGGYYSNAAGCGLTGVNATKANTGTIAGANTAFCQGFGVPFSSGTNDPNPYTWYWNNQPVGGFSSTGWWVAYPGLPAPAGQQYGLQIDENGKITNTGASPASAPAWGANTKIGVYDSMALSAANPFCGGVESPLGVGLVDTTAALQKCMDTGLNVVFPHDGNPLHAYRITSALDYHTAGQEFIGAGTGGSVDTVGIFQMTPGADVFHSSTANLNSVKFRNLRLGYAGPTASGVTATATLSGGHVTSFTVTSGGTNVYTTGGVGVLGCGNVYTIWTVSGGAVTAISPASGYAALGTLAPSATTGQCYDDAVNVWVAGATVPRSEAIIATVSGTKYLFIQTYPGGVNGSTVPLFSAVYGSSTSDNTAVYKNMGVYGSVAIAGGSTGDPTGTASVGYCINMSPSSVVNNLFVLDNIVCSDEGGGFRLHSGAVTRAHNIRAEVQDGNGYGLLTDGGSINSEDIQSFSWSGYGDAFFLTGGNGGNSITVKEAGGTGVIGRGGIIYGITNWSVSGGNQEGIAGSNLRIINASVDLKDSDFLGGITIPNSPIEVTASSLSINLPTVSNLASWPFDRSLVQHLGATPSAVTGFGTQTPSGTQVKNINYAWGNNMQTLINGNQVTIGPLPVMTVAPTLDARNRLACQWTSSTNDYDHCVWKHNGTLIEADIAGLAVDAVQPSQVATSSSVGVVKCGSGLTCAGDGTVSVSGISQNILPATFPIPSQVACAHGGDLTGGALTITNITGTSSSYTFTTSTAHAQDWYIPGYQFQVVGTTGGTGNYNAADYIITAIASQTSFTASSASATGTVYGSGGTAAWVCSNTSDALAGGGVDFTTSLAIPVITTPTQWNVHAMLSLFTTATAPGLTGGILKYGGSQISGGFVLPSPGNSKSNMGQSLDYVMNTWDGNHIAAAPINLGGAGTYTPATRNLSSGGNLTIGSFYFSATGLGGTSVETYSSGASACTDGTQVVTFTNGTGSGGTGTITVSGNVPTGAVTFTHTGHYTVAPTQGTIATCTGTATFTFSGALGGEEGNMVRLSWFSAKQQ